jgi:hypothetical protein
MPIQNNKLKPNGLNIIIILVFLSTNVFSDEISERYYSRSDNNLVCSNKYKGCSFKVSRNYPISPKIPTSIPSDAILGSYRYIYLLFSIPKDQTQKTFYLESYDISNGETIISNGDCYFINTTVNTDYEIRIFNKLKEDSFVQFGFLGIPKNFVMTVKLEFQLSISLYVYDFALTYTNSLIKNNQPSLVKYFQELEKDLKLQNDRQTLARQAINRIMNQLFGTTVDLNLFKGENICSATFSVPPFTITISYAVGLELSPEQFFKLRGTMTSETTVINGVINSHVDGTSLLNGKIDLDNNIIKLLEAYNQNVSKLVLEFGLETDSYTVTVGVDSNCALIFTIRFYYEKTKAIYFEIEIIIEVDNYTLKQQIRNEAHSYAYAYNYDYSYSYPDIKLEPILFGECVAIAAIFIIIFATDGAGAPLLSLIPVITQH